MKLLDNPRYAAAHQKVRSLTAELSKVQTDQETWRNRLAAIARNDEDVARGFLAESTDEYNPNILRNQLEDLVQREKLLVQAIEIAKQDLDAVYGVTSLKICQSERDGLVKLVRQNLQDLKAICDRNDAIRRRRSELENQGVRLDHLPDPTFFCGPWDDAPFFGGMVGAYRRCVEEWFPEIKKA